MKVVNQLHPAAEQAQTFFTDADDGPFVMVNLLKFHDKAHYADGSEPGLSGREAYLRYGMAVGALVERVGGKVGYAGPVTGLMIGEVEELWDMVALAQYPSPTAMRDMVMSADYQAIAKHREAGLAGQLNIKTKGTLA